MYVILWEFLPAPGREAEFERAYGHDGDWARFFRRDSGFLGTDLLRDTKDPRRFITVDKWTSQKAFDEFAKREAPAYRELDEKLAPLSAAEMRIGSFTAPP
jgi:quinol monooxygenase YgiN